MLPDLLLRATTRLTDSGYLLIIVVPKGFLVENSNGDGNCFCGFGFWDADFFQ